MRAEEILKQLKESDEVPEGWIVFPLLRNKVRLGIVGWIFGVIMGLGLFALVASAVIPANFQKGALAAIITLLLLGILLFIGIGSIWALVYDVRRLMDAERHNIVLTPEDFVKQEGEKIIHVPFMNIRYVTARGAPPPDRNPSRSENVRQMPGVGETIAGFFLGRNLAAASSDKSRSRMRPRRTPTTLAFIDTRTDEEVVVTDDKSFGDTFIIAALMKEYAAAIQHIFR